MPPPNDITVAAAEARIGRGDFDGAQRILRALLLDPGDEEKSEVYWCLSGLHARQDNYARALKLAHRCLEHDPDHLQAQRFATSEDTHARVQREHGRARVGWFLAAVLAVAYLLLR